MNKTKKLAESIFNKDIVLMEKLMQEILSEKILMRLQEEKQKFSFTEGVRPQTMKFIDAHNVLNKIGYTFSRQNGTSHKVYKKQGSPNIVISPHGKDISSSSTRDVYNALKLHTELSEKFLQDLNNIKNNILFKEQNSDDKHHLNIIHPNLAQHELNRKRYSLEKLLDKVSKKKD